jgi:Flp pilus assembly protein TadG
MTTLTGMLAFAIDIGYLAMSKSEMRRTADSAALAGGWQLLDSKIKGENSLQASACMRAAASQVALQNTVCNSGPILETVGEQTDITEGYLANMSATSTLSMSSQNPFQAVRVRVQRTAQSNGIVPFFFARVFGETGTDMTVQATSAMAIQVKGFSVPPTTASTINLLPFALDLQTWNNMLNGGGSDIYNYNTVTGLLTKGNDGVREVNLYPQGTGSPGNRGTVDIGGSNNSTSDIARQIISGISSEDLEDLGKPLVLEENGTMSLNGDTGISAGVKDELASIIGETRIIPIFSQVSGNGNNANYTIVQWAGVRILNVKLTGPMSSKQLIVQPAPVIARNVVAGDASRTWSDSIYSAVVLVQ